VALCGAKDLFLSGATVRGFLMMESFFSLISNDGSFKLSAKLILEITNFPSPQNKKKNKSKLVFVAKLVSLVWLVFFIV
jgi:hypothetical protein